MTTTMTINDRLVELGDLVGNQEQSIQRSGAEMIEAFFNTHQQGDNVDDATTAQLLYYLTDIQVRDYALGLINPDESVRYITALGFLLEHAPTDTIYINAPASLLSVLHYEMDDIADAVLMLSNASTDYSLAQLLMRVYRGGWLPGGFAKMRKELHPQVTASIFGDNND
jgi:hypothetical protein